MLIKLSEKYINGFRKIIINVALLLLNNEGLIKLFMPINVWYSDKNHALNLKKYLCFNRPTL